ncbi:hypothetical protein GCM10009808_15520 [Microbacterium sediminicola]|uniref:Uncharacterized protein n=1 Tax=Microbacterium sediminicola TaxID=415210 RepID=A0ABN2I5A7_9MICO
MYRWMSGALVAVFAAAFVVTSPNGALAVESTPAPVVPFPAVPSQLTSALSGSDVGAIDYANALVAVGAGAALTTIGSGGSTAGALAAQGAKPITAAAQLARGGGAAASVLIAAQVGWAIGQGGLVLYSAATQTDYADLICRTPDWYQSANSFIMLGIAPDCTAPVLDVNVDQLATTYATIPGYGEFHFVGTRSNQYSTWAFYCGPQTQLDSSLRYRLIWDEAGVDKTFPTWADSSSQIAINEDMCGYHGAMYIYQDQLPSDRVLMGLEIVLYPIQAGVDPVATAELETVTEDPLRTPTCSIDWDDGSTTTGVGTAYAESVGVDLTAADMGCTTAWDAKPGAGITTMPTRIGVTSDDGSGNVIELTSQDVPTYSPDQKVGLTADPGVGLVLEKAPSGGEFESCNRWIADCVDWWAATSQGTLSTTQALDTYRCTFGGVKVDLSECGIYAYTFDTRTAVGTQTQTATITDPATGQQVQWQNEPGLNSVSPAAGIDPAGECLASWSDAMNPIEWVLQPVKCALVWAFVPRTQVVTQAQTAVATAWSGTMVGKLGDTVAGWSFTAPASGCGGLNVGISAVWPMADDFTILNACPGEPLAPIASLSSITLGIFAVLGAAFSVTRSVGSVVGFTGLGGD